MNRLRALFPTDRYGLLFLTTGLAVQVGAFLLAPGNPWSLVSGLLGICSVVLCSQGNILTFFFGFGQILTYTYLCWLERFYAGIAINVFYFLSQFAGLWVWHRRRDGGSSGVVRTRRLGGATFTAVTLLSLGLSALTGALLAHHTDDTQPWLDAFTTVPAIAAQILMVLAYREQWYYWLAIDLVYLLLWFRADNWSMVMQYAFWCVNCVYGLVQWTQRERGKR